MSKERFENRNGALDICNVPEFLEQDRQEKMDNKILNEYCEKECKDFLQCGFLNKEHCPFHKGIKYGLEKGRKESKIDKDILLSKVLSENEQLKEQIKEYEEMLKYLQ